MHPFPLWADPFLFPLVFLSLLGLGAGSMRLFGWNVADDFPGGPLGRFLAAAGLGYGVLALGVLGIAALQILSAPILWGVLALGLGLAWMERGVLDPRSWYSSIRPVNRWESLLAAILGLRLGYHWIGCFLPVFGQDELTYHLLMPRQYLLEGGLFATPHLLHGNFPFNAEMVFTFCLNFGSEMLAKQVQWGLWVILHLALIGAARRVHPSAGYLTALLYTVPVGSVYLRAPMETGSDAPIAFCLGLALYFLIVMETGNWRTGTLLAAVMNGLAWGTKYVAPVFVTPLIGIVLILRLRSLGASVAEGVRAVAVFGLLNVALFAPWMIKNMVYTGNPVYPMLATVFPSPHPYDDIVHRLFEYEHISNFYLDEDGSGPDGAGEILQRAASNYVFGKHQWPIFECDFLLILFLASSFAGLFVRDSRIRALAVAGLFAHVVFFFIIGAHINRFFAVTYPLAAILVGALGGAMLERSGRMWFWQTVLGVVLFLAAINLQLRWNGYVFWNGLPMFTQAAHDQYRQRFSSEPEVDAFWRQVPERTPREAKILGHGIRYPYFLERRIDCICDFENEILVDWYEQTGGDWEKVAAKVRESGYTHLILSPLSLSWKPVGEPPVPFPRASTPVTEQEIEAKKILWPPEEWLDRHTRLLISGGSNELREILPIPR